MREKNRKFGDHTQLIQQALSAHQAGLFDQAESLYKRVVKNQPRDANALYLLGTLYLQINQEKEGLELLQASLAVNPSQPAALNNYGATLHKLGHLVEALECLNQALALDPSYAEGHYNLGNILLALRRQPEAVLAFEQAVALNPAHAMAYNNMGVALYELRRFQAALQRYAKALEYQPQEAQFYSNSGNAFMALECHAEAIGAYQKAIAIDAGFADAYHGLGLLYTKIKQHHLAVESYIQLMQVAPDYEYALGSLIHACQHCCLWDGLNNLMVALEQGLRLGQRVSPPFPAVTSLDITEAQISCARVWVQDKHPARAPLWRGEVYLHEKIRVAYVSADFYNHATAYLAAELFELHDRELFEIYAVSISHDVEDHMNKRVTEAFCRYVNGSAMSDFEIARLLREWEIDIVVDLKGHTQNARFDIFAYRAAPLQIGFLGYPGTSGAEYIDYILADKTVIPPEQERYYSEKIAWLPDCYQPNDRQRQIAENSPTRIEQGLPANGFVFCCFNAHYKLTEAVFAIWMRLLHQVPESVLWLLDDNPVSVDQLCAYAESQGVHANRLVFAPRLGLADHLARHRHADLFLDTFPTTAHTTASDALWAGLPVLTRVGNTFASSVSASLLKTVKLPELVTNSFSEYESMALALAAHASRLQMIKARLNENRDVSPLFDTPLFCRHIESAYRFMFSNLKQGKTPQSFSVPRIQ